MTKLSKLIDYKSLFKGYIPTKGKKPIIKFEQYLTEPPVDGDFGGILKDNYMLIDIDNEQDAETVFNIIKGEKLNCIGVKTTRGYHFYFKQNEVKKNAIHVRNLIGLEVDIIIGRETSQVPIRINGEYREVIYSTGDLRKLDKCPFYLCKVIENSPLNFRLDDGDGRNDFMFNHILNLQKKFTKHTIIEVANIINKYLFKKSLSTKEFNTLVRDEVFSKNNKLMFFDDNNKFLHTEFLKYLIEKYNITIIDEQLKYYNGKIYIDNEYLFHRIIYSELETLKYNQVVDVSKLAKLKAPILNITDNYNLIALQNGVYDIETDTLLNFNKSYYLQQQLNCEYKPNVYSKVVDDMLFNVACGNTEIIDLLEEMIGFCFYRRNELGKAFFLLEDGSNGKSTFVDTLRHLLGNDNVSSNSITDLLDRFRGSLIKDKLANIGDDIGHGYLKDATRFKALVTGQSVVFEEKHAKPFQYSTSVKFIFTLNKLPQTDDKSGAWLRRMVIIPFLAKFDKKQDNFDPEIIDKLKTPEAMNYLFLRGLLGLKRVLKNKGFTEPDIVKAELNNYNYNNNPILSFFTEHSDDIENKSVNQVYNEYKLHCFDSNNKPLAKNNFSAELKKQLNIESVTRRVNGKVMRLYVKVGDKLDDGNSI